MSSAGSGGPGRFFCNPRTGGLAVTSSEWFQRQLQASADGFVWAVEQVPAERRFLRPPLPLGEWSAARHAFHLLYYERTIALPSMRQWLGEAMPSMFGASEDTAWSRGGDWALDGLLAEFQEVRARQIALLPAFDEGLWDEPRQTVWRTVTLRWVVTKTYQHTAEHTHDVRIRCISSTTSRQRSSAVDDCEVDHVARS